MTPEQIPAPLFSGSIKSGKGTVFVDLKVAKNGNEFLSISESAYDKDDVRKRTTIRIFGSAVNAFRSCIADVPAVVARELTKEEAAALDAKRAQFKADKEAAREIEAAQPKRETKKY